MNRVPKELWPPVFDAAIFDFDGTIANTAWIWEQVDRIFLGQRGIPYTEDYARMLAVLGFTAGAQYTIETYGLDERPEDIIDEWTRLSHALYSTSVELRPGAERYLKALHAQGVRLALATANEPELISAMELVDTDGLFDICIHGRDVGAAKDQPDIYLEAARQLGVAPERCIVFEDIVPGIVAARDAGFLTCAVNAHDPAQDLAEIIVASDLILDHWRDIPCD